MRTWMLGLFCLTGCAEVVYAAYTPSTPTAIVGRPRSAEQVELLSEMPTRPHTQIGMIGSREPGVLRPATVDEIYQAMREAAARHYCDALVISPLAKPVLADGAATQRYNGACLVYNDAPAPATAPVGTVASAACNPICSPGYACQSGVCVPQCNPVCSPGFVCADDRTCKAVEIETTMTAPQPAAQ